MLLPWDVDLAMTWPPSSDMATVAAGAGVTPGQP